MVAVLTGEPRETFDGIATNGEPLQLGQDVPGQAPPPFLQRVGQLRQPLADEAVQQIIGRAAPVHRQGRRRRDGGDICHIDSHGGPLAIPRVHPAEPGEGAHRTGSDKGSALSLR